MLRVQSNHLSMRPLWPRMRKRQLTHAATLYAYVHVSGLAMVYGDRRAVGTPTWGANVCRHTNVRLRSLVLLNNRMRNVCLQNSGASSTATPSAASATAARIMLQRNQVERGHTEPSATCRLYGLLSIHNEFAICYVLHRRNHWRHPPARKWNDGGRSSWLPAGTWLPNSLKTRDEYVQSQLEHAGDVRLPQRISPDRASARVTSRRRWLTACIHSRKCWRILEIAAMLLLAMTILLLVLSTRYTICYVAVVDNDLLINTHIVAGRLGMMVGRLHPAERDITGYATGRGVFVRDAAGSIRLVPPLGMIPLGLGARLYYVELWLIAVPLVVFLVFCRIAVHFAVRQQQAIDNCQHCGYSLRGNQSGVCPECGKRDTRRVHAAQ